MKRYYFELTDRSYNDLGAFIPDGYSKEVAVRQAKRWMTENSIVLATLVVNSLRTSNVLDIIDIDILWNEDVMEAKFKKGQSVRITKRNGEVIDGVIRDWDYNICTFGREYNVDYMKDGQVWTVICVPEDAIQELR